MSKLLILAPAYYDTMDACCCLVESCQRLGLWLELYGAGEKWPWHLKGKVERPLQEVERHACTHVLFTDAEDTVMLADEQEIMAKYHAFKCEIVASCERDCWPDSEMRSRFPYSYERSRFINSGGYMGTKQAMTELWQRMRKVEPMRYNGDDQMRLQLAYVDTWSTRWIRGDYHSDIFQTMSGGASEDVTWTARRAVNMRHASQPCQLHFNGKLAGVEDAFVRRFEPRANSVTT